MILPFSATKTLPLNWPLSANLCMSVSIINFLAWARQLELIASARITMAMRFFKAVLLVIWLRLMMLVLECVVADFSRAEWCSGPLDRYSAYRRCSSPKGSGVPGQWTRVPDYNAPLLQCHASYLSSPPWLNLLLRWLTVLDASTTS